jgi:hypothetical protein
VGQDAQTGALDASRALQGMHFPLMLRTNSHDILPLIVTDHNLGKLNFCFFLKEKKDPLYSSVYGGDESKINYIYVFRKTVF